MVSWEGVFTKKNLEVLTLLRKGEWYIRDIAERVGISPAKAHQSIKLFEQIGLVTISEHKNRKYAKLNPSNPHWHHLDALLFGKESDALPVPDIFDTLSPLDFRYAPSGSKVHKLLHPYLSETGFIRYMAKTEAALATGLAEYDLCPHDVAQHIQRAATRVTAAEVYVEETRIKHNVRALANCLRDLVPEEAKPYVHMTATSHDIICTSDAARFKDCTIQAVLPLLTNLFKALLHLAERESATVQIGRTHGQHAEPTTFGYAVAFHLDRLGHRLLKVEETARNLRGKLAGPVGAYNGQALFVKDPQELEKSVLSQLGIKPSPISTQIVEPEYFVDYTHALVSTFSILANIADDFRHLQRTEINELAESFGKQQVGSSTMPHKRNPINFENVKSLWKVAMPRMQTLYLDQISEHQRDLTNSASARFTTEIVVLLCSATERLTRTISNLVVDKAAMQTNFATSKDLIAAEPAYLLLAKYGCPNAHEQVRKHAQQSRTNFIKTLLTDANLSSYLSKFTKEEKTLLTNPAKYIGLAQEKTHALCTRWKETLTKKSWSTL